MGTEPLPIVQIKARLRDKRDIPRLLPNWHTTDVPINASERTPGFKPLRANHSKAQRD
jgi:hypothetical protein